MAYAFNRINDLVRKKSELFQAPEDGESTEDRGEVFGAGAAPDDEKPDIIPASKHTIMPKVSEKSLASTVSTAPTESQMSPSQSIKSPRRLATRAPRVSIEETIPHAVPPRRMREAQEKVKERLEDIREKAKAYMETRREELEPSTRLGLTDEEIEAALQYGGTGTPPENFEKIRKFFGFDPKIREGEIPDIESEIPEKERLNRDYTIEQEMRRVRGPRYTPGMRQFDIEAIRRTPGFNRIIRDVLAAQHDLGRVGERIYRGELESMMEELKAVRDETRDPKLQRTHEIMQKNISDMMKRRNDYINKYGHLDTLKHVPLTRDVFGESIINDMVKERYPDGEPEWSTLRKELREKLNRRLDEIQNNPESLSKLRYIIGQKAPSYVSNENEYSTNQQRNLINNFYNAVLGEEGNIIENQRMYSPDKDRLTKDYGVDKQRLRELLNL